MKRHLVHMIETLCAIADRIPSAERVDGKWRLFLGGYGCRMGIARLACDLDERWETGVWRP